jgi:hypothetical protein
MERAARFSEKKENVILMFVISSKEKTFKFWIDAKDSYKNNFILYKKTWLN